MHQDEMARNLSKYFMSIGISMGRKKIVNMGIGDAKPSIFGDVIASQSIDKNGWS